MSEHRLSEIVIERPRSGMRMSSRKLKGEKQRLRRLTQEATEDGLLSPYLIKPRQKSKYFSDHLGPLRRWLRSHVGQPWDAVYSKLCQQLDTSTLAGQHVLSHVWDYVERHVEIIDGVLYEKPDWGQFRPLESHYRDRFYVHPETCLLCLVEKKRRKSKPTPPTDVLAIDANHQYRQLKGIWYRVTFAEFPAICIDPVIDILRGQVSAQTAEYIAGRRVYAVSKQQCNKKEIRLIKNQLAQQST
ncbi:MAG: hypothetical protein F6K00_17775 [Leptolyngbya sp. SIOISBB]|nr:hypothetical protein [Leptolyngbya sp. SIOISBB]